MHFLSIDMKGCRNKNDETAEKLGFNAFSSKALDTVSGKTESTGH